MDQSVTSKLDEAQLVRGRNVRKYSWLEDACVWFEHYPLGSTMNMDVPLSTRSRGSICDRFNTLRSIADVVVQHEVDLSNQPNIRIWDHFINYKFGVIKSGSRFSPQVNTSTVAALAKPLNLAFDFLFSRLQLIQNMKHYLYFSGIHLNEDYSLDEYALTGSLQHPNKSTISVITPARAAAATPFRGGDFTFSELQALYQFKHQAYRTITVQDLAQQLNRPLETVKNGLVSGSQLNVEVERIIAEGVTLMWGEDTDLWHSYISQHTVGSTYPVHMLLSTTISGIVAKERNMRPMQAHFRINLVRKLKKFLHIAGIHDEQRSTQNTASVLPKYVQPRVAPVFSDSSAADVNAFVPLFAPTATSATALSSAKQARAVVSEVLNTAVDVLMQKQQVADAVKGALNDSIASIEINAEVSGCVTVVISDVVDMVEMMSNARVEPDSKPQNTAEYDTSDTTTPFDDSAPLPLSDDVVDALHSLVGAVESTALLKHQNAAISANNGFRCSTTPAPTLPTLTTTPETALTKESLPSTTSNDQVSTSSSLHLIHAASPKAIVPAISGAGNPYTIAEDRVIWQCWRRFGREGRNACAAQLQRSPDAIRKRVQHITDKHVRAEQAVSAGVTLLPTNTVLQMWWAYCAFNPPMQGDNSVYLYPGAVKRVAYEHALNNIALYKNLQAVRAIKWFLDLTGIHQDTGTVNSERTSYHEQEEPTQEAASHSTIANAPDLTSALSVIYSPRFTLPSAPLQLDATEIVEPETQPATSILSHTTDVVTPPLNPLAAPFAFSLQDEAEIWCAYVKSQSPTSHKSLPSRLLKLAVKVGCTFVQIKERLNELINLHIGLAEQGHSSGRPFTTTEDSMIATDVIYDTTNSSKTDALVQVAARLRCSVGAVAVRSRQLQTLRILDAVSSRIHAKQCALSTKPQHVQPQSVGDYQFQSAQQPTPHPSLQPQPVQCVLLSLDPTTAQCLKNRDSKQDMDGSLLGKRTNPATEHDSSHKITRVDADYSCNIQDEGAYIEEMSAHFSTEGEASDG